MIPDIPEASADGTPLTPNQRKCMQDLVLQLREITLKIEELDTKEEHIQRDSSGGRDQLRAINIARIVYVNQQQDIERKLDDVLNSCPAEPEPISEPMPEPVDEPMQMENFELAPREPMDVEMEPRESVNLELESSLESISIEPVTRRGTESEEMETFELEPREPMEQDPIQEEEANVVLTHREIPHHSHQLRPVEKQPQEAQLQVEEKKKKSKFQFNVLSFKICPVCDARVPANFRRCGRCATRLDNICPHCGMAVPEGVAFCGRCGKNIT